MQVTLKIPFIIIKYVPTHIRTLCVEDEGVSCDRCFIIISIRAKGYELDDDDKKCSQKYSKGMSVKGEIVRVVSHVTRRNNSLELE